MADDRPNHDRKTQTTEPKHEPKHEPRPDVGRVMKTVLGGGNPGRDEYER